MTTNLTPSIITIVVATKRGEACHYAERIQVHADKGIVGDRYYDTSGQDNDKQITLIENEQIQNFNQANNLSIQPTDFRRNLVTQGIDLNNLVGKEFYIGDVKLRGEDYCEPCRLIGTALSNEHLPAREVIRQMTKRGGLRAQILSSGVITTKSLILPEDQSV